MAARKLALVVEYDGAGFHGFQRQKNAHTVQAAIEGAIEKLTQESVSVAGAGRTDTGVHATGQVISFSTSSDMDVQDFIEGLNHHLAPDVACRFGREVPAGFNPRRDAVRRTYCYTILNRDVPSPLLRRQTYHVGRHLDIDLMNEACRLLLGRQDLASFTTVAERNTVRTVHSAEFARMGEVLVFTMAADAFLRRQVRCTVGTLVRVGLGKLGVDGFRDMIESKTPGAAWPATPACGLCLVRVEYDGWDSLERTGI